MALEKKDIQFITEQFEEVTGVVTKSLEKQEKSFDEKLVSAKSELTAEIKAAKESADNAAKESKANEDEIGSVKGKLQNIEVKFDEMEKKMNTSGMFNQEEKAKPFNEILAKAIEERSDDFAKMGRGEKGVKHIEIELKAVGDITTSNVTGGSVWGANYKPGIIEAPKRKVHMRQLLSGGSIGAGTDYYFMKQNGAGEGSIAFTAETGTKPQTDEDLVESSVKIECLAGWARVSRKAMNNIPGFVSFLQSRMVEKLLKAEDTAILYGTGTSPQPKGILVSGNFTASTSAASKLVEKIIDDIAALEDTAEREANFIALRPQHYYGFFKNTASGSGEYDLPSNVMIVNGNLYISGVLAVPTTALAINAGTPNNADYIVGDASGAQFLTQESMKIEFFEQDSTNVRENKVTVRIEEYVALPVFGADYFIKGTQNVIV